LGVRPYIVFQSRKWIEFLGYIQESMMRKRKRKNLFSDDKINEEIEMKTFSERGVGEQVSREREHFIKRRPFTRLAPLPIRSRLAPESFVFLFL